MSLKLGRLFWGRCEGRGSPREREAAEWLWHEVCRAPRSTIPWASRGDKIVYMPSGIRLRLSS